MDTDLPYRLGRRVQRIGIENREIRELACLDRANEVIHPQGVGRPERHGVQGLRDAQPLLRPEQTPRGREAVHRTPRCEEWPERCDRRIRVDRERNAEPCGAPGRIEPRGPLRPHRQVVVGIAPEVEMVREQVEAQAECLDPAQLRFRRHLAVLEGVPMVRARMGDLRLLH